MDSACVQQIRRQETFLALRIRGIGSIVGIPSGSHSTRPSYLAPRLQAPVFRLYDYTTISSKYFSTSECCWTRNDLCGCDVPALLLDLPGLPPGRVLSGFHPWPGNTQLSHLCIPVTSEFFLYVFYPLHPPFFPYLNPP